MESCIDRNNFFSDVTDTKKVNYKKNQVKASLNVPVDKTSRPLDGETCGNTKDEDDKIENLFNEFNRKFDLGNFSCSIDPIIKYLSLWMHYWEDITFERSQTRSILGFKCIRDEAGCDVGYRETSHIHSLLTSQNFIPTSLLISLLELK